MRSGCVIAGPGGMSERPFPLSGAVLAGGILAGLLGTGVALWPARGADTASVPNFAPNSATGWVAQDDEFIQPPRGAGPVTFDPAYPYISFYKWPQNPKPAFRVADLSNPILQPWAREELR